MVAVEGKDEVGEKVMVVLSSLAAVEEGEVAIVEKGGKAVLVEAVEDGSPKGKEFSVLTLLVLCGDSVRNRGLLVREGGIPPLVALSQTGTAKAKHKKRRWGSCLTIPWCFGSHKQTKRIGHAVLFPETTAQGTEERLQNW